MNIRVDKTLHFVDCSYLRIVKYKTAYYSFYLPVRFLRSKCWFFEYLTTSHVFKDVFCGLSGNICNQEINLSYFADRRFKIKHVVVWNILSWSLGSPSVIDRYRLKLNFPVKVCYV